MSEKIEVKKAAVSVSGKMNVAKINGKQFSREEIKALPLEAGISYKGRNSNKEKCISCSPKEAGIHWMHVSFSQNDTLQDLWICENCNRAYPSKAGKSAFEKMLKK